MHFYQSFLKVADIYIYIKRINIMILNKITKETYPDRKEAKRVMGHANYNKAVKRGELEYIISTHRASDIIL